MMNVEIKKTEPKLRLKVKKQNIVDIEQTKKFLEVLGGKDDKFTFQTFDDCRDSKRHGLVKQFHGTINEYIDELTQLNKKGAGVFVTVNCTDLKGRTKKNIIGLRALFVDNDTGPLPALKLKPSMVVSSKNGEHAYWVLNEGQPIERFTDGQKTLIHHLNTDKSVHDLPRVMRLPGFLHIKDPNDPFLVVIKENEAVTYTIDEVLEVYPPLKKISSKKDTTDVESGDYDNFKKWADELPAEENTENKYGGRHKTALILVREGLGRKISDEKILQVLHDYCDRSNSEKTTHKFDYEEADEILRTQIAQHNEMPFESFFKKLYFKIFWIYTSHFFF